MDSESCYSISLLQPAFGILFFTFTVLFSTFSLLIFLFTRIKPLCSCDICRSYLTASWRNDFNNLCDWYTYLLAKSPTGTIHVHVLGATITANPENVEHILKTKFNNYPKGKPFFILLRDLLGRGIFNVDGDSWKFQRKMASLELGSVSIRCYAFELAKNEIQSRLVPLLSSAAENNSVLDLQDVLRRFSFDTICKFSFGLDPGCLNLNKQISEFALAFDLATKLSAERAMAPSQLTWKIKRLLNLGSEKQLRESIKLVKELAEELIKQRRDMGASDRNDLLSRFISYVDDDGYIRDITISFLLAGRDTVASGLTSFFWLLSRHPEVESAIRAESDGVLGKSKDIVVSFEQLRELHYLNGAVHESLRLFPPVQFDSKFAQEDDVLPDSTLVRKGTRVTYHPYAMGRMERVWGTDCQQFKPERWLKDGRFVPVNPFKYPVFQAGPRVCLGRELALVEMKAVALALIRRFDIRVAEPDRAPVFVPALTATISGGLPVKVRGRRD